MEVLLATPRGFCAGVERAIAIVLRVLEKYGAPIYVRHEVVHNRYVVEDLRCRGAVFVEELDEVPDVPGGATVIFSAHGVSKAVREEAARRGLRVFDATCPLVTKVHMEVGRQRLRGLEVVMIGHRGHPEVEGTMGQSADGMHLVENAADVPKLKLSEAEFQSRLMPASAGVTPKLKVSAGETAPLAYVTQTTLSVDDAAAVVAALKERFPDIDGPRRDDICYATQSRQDAVRRLAERCDLILVVGSNTSSNSNRLREVAAARGVEAHLVDGPEDIRTEWLAGRALVGVTAGASAPEILVERVIRHLVSAGATAVQRMEGDDENIVFALPRLE
ncbi:MAG: 4-hydroxy-3-methylbut-2-enyl diphosphate reductase [Rhodocyclaceae bacterium]|nr:4-hydroxy-3-methylbut-2-enyl diphosphate reductase [Rhodocyclaceae bacterium]